MISSDIIMQLRASLPLYTDLFNDVLTIAGITSIGTVATATTAIDHSLVTGEIVTITGATTPLVISSFTRSGTVGTIVTATDHDFTYSDTDKVNKQFTDNQVIVTGATEAEFNGTFLLNPSLNVISVPNRRTLIVVMDDSGATVATGSVILQNGNAFSYNGTFNVTVIDSTTFEYTLPLPLPLPADGSPILSSKFRISGALTSERFINDSYTQQEVGKLWACVVMDDTLASKQRDNLADSTAQYPGRSTYYRQELIQNMSIIVVQSMGGSLSGQAERELIEQTVTQAIFNSILGVNFPTYFDSDDDKRLTFNTSSILFYDVGKYAHQFTFEQDVQIVACDISPPDFNVALRDISLTFTTQLGTQERALAIDTDEVPL